MNKSAFIAQLVERTGYSEPEIRHIFEEALSQTVETLAQGDCLRFMDFGTLAPWEQKERAARNPHSGEIVMIPRRVSVKFRPGKFFIEKLND